MRRTVLLVLVSLAAAGSVAFFAYAQDPVEVTPAELHLVRGTLAWKRAVWAVNADGFQRAANELEKCREDPKTRSDFTMLYLLGVSYMRLGRLAEAETPLRDARLIKPDFPGFWLTDAMRAVAVKPDDEGEARDVALDALSKYDNFLEGMPKDGPLADEFRFLGLVLRGTLRSRVPAVDPKILAGNDRALADLEEARALAAKQGAPPSAELLSILAHVHQSLNQPETAKKLVKEAMARDPAEASHYLNYGMIVAGTQNEDEARSWFEQALARRAAFPEAHVKLAYLDSRADRLAEMRKHLDAAQSMYDGRAKTGSKSDARTQADLEAGFGTYWRLIGRARTEKGDDAGAREAYEKAKTHFLAALAKEPNCASALNALIQLLDWLGAPQAQIQIYKDRLEKAGEQKYKSTFC